MADLRTHGGDDADRSQDSGGRRLYNPYNDLQIPYRTLYDIPTSPEFLFQEESLAQRRSWDENLAYYTGIGYLAGGASGAFLAVRRALRSAEPGDTLKIRDTDDWINSVVAGLGTGALFRAANGPRSAVVAGAIGGLMVGAAVAGKQILKRYVPI